MLARIVVSLLAAAAVAGGAFGQTPGGSGQWRTPDGKAVQQATATVPVGENAAAPRRSAARVSAGPAELPSDHGQLWREYDISPYTLRVASTNRPEQAIVDWILRDTGYEAWHGEPFGILSADARRLLVYHTPEMQQKVAEVVDRFVSSEAESQAFELRVVTIDHPNWRAKAQRLLRPVQAQTPGVQAWLLSREDVAALAAELRRRSDYREHSAPQLAVSNGQSTVVSATRTRNYVRDILPQAAVWPGYQPQQGVLNEGFTLEFSPLVSVDGQQIDATIKCDVDQVEKLVPVAIEMPTPAAPRGRAQLDVPQVAAIRFHERFRWPVDQVLLVSLGMIPAPVPMDSSLIPGVPLPLPSGPPRVELLIFVARQGKAAAPAALADRPQTPASGAY
jgi:hypothetical protein